MPIDEEDITHDGFQFRDAMCMVGWGGAVLDEEHSRLMTQEGMVTMITFVGIPCDPEIRMHAAQMQLGVLMDPHQLGSIAALLRTFAEAGGFLPAFLHEYDQSLVTYRKQNFTPSAPRMSRDEDDQ